MTTNCVLATTLSPVPRPYPYTDDRLVIQMDIEVNPEGLTPKTSP